MAILITVGALTCAYAFHFSATPPSQNEMGEAQAHPVQKTTREKIIAALTPALVNLFWAKSILDIVRAAQCNSGRQPASYSFPLCFGQLPPYRYLAGWALVTTAALIRRACYRELGGFFTFAVSIQDRHKLVRSGPYSIVRHPGYGACIVLTVGIVMLHTANLPTVNGFSAPLSWRLEGWYNLLFILLMTYGLRALLKRANVEDILLRKRCGQEWVDYSLEVPYQFIPLVW